MRLKVQESGIDFIITGSYAIKLDEHPFYKYFSGRGFKSVDFLIVQEDTLFIVEVKNYQYYPNTVRPYELELHQNFLQKCEDTLHLLDNFHDFMEQSFIKRVLVQKWKWYFLGHAEWKEWLRAYEIYKAGDVVCILHAD